MKKSGIGKLDWAFSAGCIPAGYREDISGMVSYDSLAVLNTSAEEIELELYIFYEEEAPIGKYSLKIKPERVRKFKFNDLIDPFPIALEKNYSCLIQASRPVVVQFTRLHVGEVPKAIMGTMAFPVEPINQKS